ncbi:MAG: methyltransferase domain-containing protein [Thiohalocapsa sp.]
MVENGWRLMYQYDTDFYGYLASFAVRSAKRVVPHLTRVLPVGSVVDFGCGQGAWLSVWHKAGAEIAGVDGAYVERSALLIDSASFRAADLAEPIDLGRCFDLVQSLEVAEHLPAARARQFVETLTAHGPCVLFSAAPPGQGGEHHVNEQPPEYWRRLFRERGFAAVDYLRPLICGDAAVKPWYRFNTLLYIAEDHLAAMPTALRERRVADGVALADYRPLACRLRQAALRHLPVAAVTRLSRLRASLATRKAAVIS